MTKPSRMQRRVNIAAQLSRDATKAAPRIIDEKPQYDKNPRAFARFQEPMPFSLDVESDAFHEMTEDEEALKAAKKGKKDQNCNRTACQKPGAFFLNIGTSKYYCVECAVDIGGFSLRTHQDPMDLFPSFDEDMVRYEKDYTSSKPAYAQHQANWAKRQWTDAREIYTRRQTGQTA